MKPSMTNQEFELILNWTDELEQLAFKINSMPGLEDAAVSIENLLHASKDIRRTARINSATSIYELSEIQSLRPISLYSAGGQ